MAMEESRSQLITTRKSRIVKTFKAGNAKKTDTLLCTYVLSSRHINRLTVISSSNSDRKNHKKEKKDGI